MRDCEVRYLPSGEPVANLNLAYDWGTQKNENGYLPSQFIEGALWGKRAESLREYLVKNTKLFLVIEDPHIETFTKSDHTDGHKLTGRIGSLEFAGSGQQNSDQDAGSNHGNQSAGRSQQQRQASQNRHSPRPSGGGVADLDDDIPYNQVPPRYDI